MAKTVTAQMIPYGAFELKNNYKRYLEYGLILAIIVHLIIIAGYIGGLYLSKLKEQESKLQNQPRIINVSITDLEPPPSANEEEVPPQVKFEQSLTPVKDLSAMEPEPVAREKAELQTIKTQKELEEIKTNVSSLGDTGKFTYTGPVRLEEKKIEEKIEKIEKKVSEEKTVYQSFEVEKPPECVNLSQVRALMKYPEIALEAGIEGKVSVKVLVGTDGNVLKIGSVSGPEVFHDEVRDKSLNLRFTPALQNGKPVKVWVTVPFNFKITN